MMSMPTPELNSILIAFLILLTGAIGWIAKSGVTLLVKRLDSLVVSVEKMGDRLSTVEQRMSASEGREEGRS